MTIHMCFITYKDSLMAMISFVFCSCVINYVKDTFRNALIRVCISGYYIKDYMFS